MKKIFCLLFAFLLLCSTPVFASQVLKDGNYTVNVEMSGGTGRVTIKSPCDISVENGKATATVILSSKHYEHMVIDGEYYYSVKSEDGSVFEIPVVLDKEINITAQTTAMGDPHDIDYVLYFDSSSIKGTRQNVSVVLYIIAACAAAILISGAIFIIRKNKRNG